MAKTTDTPRQRRPRRRLSAFGVVSASLGTFFAVLTLLGWQMAEGHDPALGPSEKAARPVLVKRIELKRIVEDPPPPVPGVVAGADSEYAGTTSTAPAPVAPTAAPVSSAPAPAPAAPVSTGGS